MKFTQIPCRQEAVSTIIEEAGHTYVDTADGAEFIVLGAGPEAVPDPLPESVKFIQTQFAGIEAFAAAGILKSSGVRWANAAGFYDDTVAESALGLLLAVNHQHKKMARAQSWDVRAEVERDTTFLFHRGYTVAVVGAGGIGTRVIELLGALKARTIAVNRSGRPVPGADETWAMSQADDVWSRADAFILLAPLTETTRHMVNSDTLARMKDTAVVVNVGRGALIDTDDLVTALEAGELGGAGLDVTEPEPLADGHPLWSMDTVVITPHTANVGWYIEEEIGHLAVRNAADFEAGKPMSTEVDLEAGY